MHVDDAVGIQYLKTLSAAQAAEKQAKAACVLGLFTIPRGSRLHKEDRRRTSAIGPIDLETIAPLDRVDERGNDWWVIRFYPREIGEVAFYLPGSGSTNYICKRASRVGGTLADFKLAERHQQLVSRELGLFVDPECVEPDDPHQSWEARVGFANRIAWKPITYRNNQ